MSVPVSAPPFLCFLASPSFFCVSSGCVWGSVLLLVKVSLEMLLEMSFVKRVLLRRADSPVPLVLLFSNTTLVGVEKGLMAAEGASLDSLTCFFMFCNKSSTFFTSSSMVFHGDGVTVGCADGWGEALGIGEAPGAGEVLVTAGVDSSAAAMCAYEAHKNTMAITVPCIFEVAMLE